MEDRIKYNNCVESLKEAGDPVIIVTAVHESEAVANACRDNGITVEAFCDSEKKSYRLSEILFIASFFN